MRTAIATVCLSGGLDEKLLAIAKPERVGIWGPEGYVGHRTAGYWVQLNGDGPTFVNPPFADDSSDLVWVGFVTLNISNETVTLNLKRVMSNDGKRTRQHPINGTYRIEQIRNARPGETLFDNTN